MPYLRQRDRPPRTSLVTPSEFLDVLDHALAPGRRGKYRLILTAPVVLGQTGTYLQGQGYGYTKRQAKRMRQTVLDAAAADAAAVASAPVDDTIWTDAPSMRDTP